MTTTPADEFPHWTNNKRSDGIRVEQPAIDQWTVIPPDHRPIIRSCPCCSKPMPNERAAKRVADHVYPLSGSA